MIGTSQVAGGGGRKAVALKYFPPAFSKLVKCWKRIRNIPQGDDRFNVLNHILVPHHELVDADDESAILAPWGLEEADDYGGTRVAKELLPKILITDPAVQAIKEKIEAEADDLPAGWLTNRIVKIIRYSRAAGSSTAFRLIVESA